MARMLWFVVLLLAIGKATFGLPLYFDEKNEVCTASMKSANLGELFEHAAGSDIGINRDLFDHLCLGECGLESVYFSNLGLDWISDLLAPA
jgi:hypothetical protein